MILTIKFNNLDFYSYKFLIDALMNGPTQVSIYCNDLPEKFQEKNHKILDSLFCYYNHTLLNYLRAKSNVSENQINKYIMDNFNNPKVQELLNDVSVIGDQID